jgi:hypothetical protein
MFHSMNRMSRSDDGADAGFFAQERHWALVGVASYAVAGLVVVCVLPVFCGATSAGWRAS